MPIRLEHQPSPIAVGMAGYAAGAGQARQRKQKYALDLFQQDRQNRFMEDRQDQRQQWMEGQQQKQQQAIDQRLQKTQEASDQRFQQQQQGIDERFQQQQQSMDARDQRRQWGMMPQLTQIPDWVDPATRRDLTQKATAIRELHSDKFAYDDPAVQAKERELKIAYEGTIAGLKPPSTAEAWNRGTTYVDEKTGQAYDQPGEGRVPYRGDKRAVDDSADKAAEKQQRADQDKLAKEQQAAAQKQYDKVKAERDAWDTTFFGFVDEFMAKDEDLSAREAQHQAGMRMTGTGRGTRPQLPPDPASATSASTPAAPAAGAPSGVVPVQTMPDGTLAPAQPAATPPVSSPRTVTTATPEQFDVDRRAYDATVPQPATPQPVATPPVVDPGEQKALEDYRQRTQQPVVPSQPQLLPVAQPAAQQPPAAIPPPQAVRLAPGEKFNMFVEAGDKPGAVASLSERQRLVTENAKRRGARVHANSQLSSARRERAAAQQAQQQKLPPGTVQLEDGSVMYNGVIYRRRQQ